MRRREHFHGSASRPRTVLAGLCLAVLLTGGVVASPAAFAQATPVPLGTAANFAVLGSTSVTNTGPTVVTGDLGVSPGNTVTGFPPGIVVGTIHVADATAAQAQTDAAAAYNDAAARLVTDTLPAELGGTTVTPGVYDSISGAFTINGVLTLDAQGDPRAVFIFQTASTLVTADASSVVLIGGALGSNVYWQVGSSATLGTDSLLVGTVLALASIDALTGADVDGRLIALSGDVTLDTNTITLVPILSITGPTAADLGSAPPGGIVQSQLGEVTVDSAEFLAWTATVSITPFTGDAGPPVLPADVLYWSGPVTSQTGIGTPLPGQPTAGDAEDLAAPITAFSMTGIDGIAALAWNPTLIVNVPLASVSGTFIATVTHSVA